MRRPHQPASPSREMIAHLAIGMESLGKLSLPVCRRDKPYDAPNKQRCSNIFGGMFYEGTFHILIQRHPPQAHQRRPTGIRHRRADLRQKISPTQQEPAQCKVGVDEFATSGGPSHGEHTPPPMRSRARRIRRRRAQRPKPILPHICMISMISVIMAALAMSLPFCNSESSPTGHAMASTHANRLEGERAIAYAALGGGISTTSANRRSRSPWRPWQRRV